MQVENITDGGKWKVRVSLGHGQIEVSEKGAVALKGYGRPTYLSYEQALAFGSEEVKAALETDAVLPYVSGAKQRVAEWQRKAQEARERAERMEAITAKLKGLDISTDDLKAALKSLAK